MAEDPSIWNQVTMKNIDNEDFVFKVNRENYLLRAGEVRHFPKFMTVPALKHLIDKILIKRDPDGKLLSNQNLRDELAAQIILEEVAYQKPSLPTEAEIVMRMNNVSDLDRILTKQKSGLKQEVVNVIPTPPVVVQETPTNPNIPSPPIATVPTNDGTTAPVVETFDQIKNEENRPKPNRQAMMDYAKNTLKMDLTNEKTQKAFEKMSDDQLFVELGLDKESDLADLGL
jgi:hypothetical protein